MMSSLRRSAGYAPRVVLAGACCCGIWSSVALARADYLFQQDTERSIREAIRWAPDGWQYYMRLAQFDRAHATQLLTTSLRLNRFDAQADIELGLQYEADGDYGRAEKQLLQAYAVDHTYMPRWSLANYYLRRDDLPAFWAWARSAADMPADDIRSLFELCWRVSPDPQTLTAKLLNEKPEFLRQYVSFLLAKDQPGAIAIIAPHLIRAGDPRSDRALFFVVIDRLVALNDAGQATALWRLLLQQRWMVADLTVPNNGAFLREPLPVSFDWALPEYQGLHSWPGASGLETEFSGSEPDGCTIAEQIVVLSPGDYTLTYAYSTSDIPPATGIRWQILDAKANLVLAESDDLSSNDPTDSKLTFTVPPGASILRLLLAYQRTLGTPHISGMLDVRSAQIHTSPKP
ncbi:MAG: tetratricopeptide repeat protein [Acidobacteriaceae bacterium]